MKFVQSTSGKEVAIAYVNSLSLSWVPSHLYFSGVAGGRIKSKSYNGQGILLTTPSHLIIFNKKGDEIWNQPLETIPTEAEGLDLRGIDLIRFTFDNKEIDFGTGLQSRKKLVTHLSEAKKESVNADDINQKLALKPEMKEIVESVNADDINQKLALKPEMKEIVQQSKETTRILREKEKETTRILREKEKETTRIQREKEKETTRIQREKEEETARILREKEEETTRILYGKLVVEDYFAKTVRIYENGYVQVSGIFVGKSAPFEKLLGISSSYNHKGDDGYLTISTDQDTHALYVGKSNMDTAYIKRMNRLTTAGQAVLESLKTRQLASTNQPQLNNESQKLLSTADEIAKLAALRDAGALTDDEFQILKNKYL